MIIINIKREDERNMELTDYIKRESDLNLDVFNIIDDDDYDIMVRILSQNNVLSEGRPTTLLIGRRGFRSGVTINGGYTTMTFNDEEISVRALQYIQKIMSAYEEYCRMSDQPFYKIAKDKKERREDYLKADIYLKMEKAFKRANLSFKTVEVLVHEGANFYHKTYGIDMDDFSSICGYVIDNLDSIAFTKEMIQVLFENGRTNHYMQEEEF